MIRLGIIGAGKIFQRAHMPELVKRQNEVSITWLAGTNTKRLAETAEAVASAGLPRPSVGTDVATLIKEKPVDCVLVAVPIPATASVVETVISAGVHVFVEKPLAETSKRAAALLALAARHGSIIFVGENFRYQKRFMAMHDYIASNTIGDIKAFRYIHMHCLPAPDKKTPRTWRQAGGYPGGYLVDGGVHAVAGLRSVIGLSLERIYAQSTAFHPEYLSQQEDTLLASMTFANNCIGVLELGYGAIDTEKALIKVYGVNGTLVLTDNTIELWDESRHTTLSKVDQKDSGFGSEWDLLLKALNGDKQAAAAISGDAIASVDDLRIIESALRSASKGTTVRCTIPGYTVS